MIIFPSGNFYIFPIKIIALTPSFLNMLIMKLAFCQHSVNMHSLVLHYFKVQGVAASLAEVERDL